MPTTTSEIGKAIGLEINVMNIVSHFESCKSTHHQMKNKSFF